MVLSIRKQASHGTSPWSGGYEVPAASRVGPGQVRSQPAVSSVADLALGIFAVNVVNPVTEVPQEPDRIEVLPHEVAGIPVQPKCLPVPNSLQHPVGRPVVVSDL